ncbi:MAG TPA: 30S ribosomal protein S6 [Egibacteraceae bacterium]|nr:30S ribosomal protein S6 [Actinomycetota bacterium]HWB72564.1 30S ribosomal protein S6 [Egibacteraceae bacterium]
MRTYELMMITNGTLDENAVAATVERFTTLVATLGGNVEGVDHWGKRQFAYEIQHMTDGYYTVVEFQLPSDGLVELERQLRLADEVVRHKIVRPGPRVKRAS